MCYNSIQPFCERRCGMIQLCENKALTELTASMIAKGREPHSLIILGERGLGKKTTAKIVASQLLCEKGDGSYCGTCRHCRLIENGTHPDLITAVSSETGNYKVDDIRKITSEAYISPSEGRYKIYLIPDLDRSVQTLAQIQNILLKLIEEPPESAVVILTARTKEIFLDTIISRTIQLQTEEVSPENAQAWLIKSGADRLTAEEAVRRCGGNIGRCLEYKDSEKLRRLADTALQAADALAASDEYALLLAFGNTDGKKEQFRELLLFLQRIARDALRMRAGINDTLAFSAQTCKKLSLSCSQKRLLRIYDSVGEYIIRAQSNCNISTLSVALAAELSGREKY